MKFKTLAATGVAALGAMAMASAAQAGAYDLDLTFARQASFSGVVDFTGDMATSVDGVLDFRGTDHTIDDVYANTSFDGYDVAVLTNGGKIGLAFAYTLVGGAPTLATYDVFGKTYPAAAAGDVKTDLYTLATSGSLTPVSAAPEPAAWALMIAGVGLAGAALRYGRREAVAVA